jgi:hypothetical protein
MARQSLRRQHARPGGLWARAGLLHARPLPRLCVSDLACCAMTEASRQFASGAADAPRGLTLADRAVCVRTGFTRTPRTARVCSVVSTSASATAPVSGAAFALVSGTLSSPRCASRPRRNPPPTNKDIQRGSARKPSSLEDRAVFDSRVDQLTGPARSRSSIAAPSGSTRRDSRIHRMSADHPRGVNTTARL